MAGVTSTAAAPPLEKVNVPPWAMLVVIGALFGAYLMLQENGWLLSSWETLHELFHDGRHAIGVPCH
jgi:cobalt transporter subunit CbtB